MSNSSDRLFEIDKVMLSEAFKHYQHLENIRLKYVSFYYATTLPLIGAAIVLARFVDDPTSILVDTVIILFCAVASAIGLIISIQLTATQSALSGYAAMLAQLRGRLYDGNEKELLTDAFLVERLKVLDGSWLTRVFKKDHDLSGFTNSIIVAGPVLVSFVISLYMLFGDRVLDNALLTIFLYVLLGFSVLVFGAMARRVYSAMRLSIGYDKQPSEADKTDS